MQILIIEPYYGGSHQVWLDAYVKYSNHNTNTLTMPAQFWKWRMQGGAVTMARKFEALPNKPDLILASDMMDVSLFRAITRTTIPIALYFHENQLTYPQNQRQHHGWQYGFINYASALAADAIFFNSEFHMNNFFEELPRMLKHFADYNELQSVEVIRQKSSVLPLGLDLKRFNSHKVEKLNEVPLILWNHRWEADKNPQAFFDALYRLHEENIDFRIAITGENFRQHPEEFENAKIYFGDKIIQYGFVDSFAEYANLLWQADYIISTAYQDFFGIAVAEGIYCGCIPLLANRLNYPYLIPAEFHEQSLFNEKALYYLLHDHLQAKVTLNTSSLQQNIAQYDWSHIAPLYDNTFQQLMYKTCKGTA